MSDQTTRLRTFVFTDIEGSTRLLRQLGAGYAGVLREHDAIITAATAAHGGEAFGSEGDAHSLVFDDAGAAVATAVEIQRALAAHAWPGEHPVRVRAGIHAGTVQRDASGFVGLALHETARISAAGHGGQVLLSPAAAELVRGSLPGGVELIDLGEHRLKDIDEPLRLWQLDIEGLESRFGPLRAQSATGVWLPHQVTSFVARGEVADIVHLGETSRLLTLTGPGGTGKTRLAVEAAAGMAGRFHDGTWFVALDAVHEARLVVPQILTALGIVGGSGPPLEQLIGWLRERAVLLVLDNLEQVLDAGIAIAQIIHECPGVTVLATSRIPLRVYGEQEYPVPALPLPPRDGGSSAERLGASASVRLFEERAAAVKPAFSVDDGNAADVADIVTRLDGLPLAIELAAARVRLLPPATLRGRLDDRLGTLGSAGRDRPDRQRTLRGAIDWSHDLLDEPDRRIFARFGVIAGSAALSQVEPIVGPLEEIGRDVLDGLESLAEQSLLRALESDDGEPRFAMLATIREYAREQLESSDEAERIRRRHAQTYLALAESVAPDLIGPNGATSNDRLERDHDDLRTALDWMVANDEAELGLRMTVALWRFWQVRGHLHEADERVHAVLAMPSVEGQPPALRSRAEAAAGGVAYWRSQTGATYRHYAAALELARETDDRTLLAEALYNAGFAPDVGEDAQWQERMLAGEDLFREALQLYRESGDEGGVARTSWSLAIQAAVRDDVEGAMALGQASLEAARSIDDRYQVGWSLHIVGQGAVATGDLDTAVAHIRESLDIWVKAGDVSGIELLLLDAAMIARARGRDACSWRLIGAEERLRQATGADIGEQSLEFPRLDPRRTPENDEEQAWIEDGRALTTGEAIELARVVALGD